MDDVQEILRQFNPGQVQVVQENKNVMRPDVMNFLMAAATASQATRMRKLMEDQASQGWTESLGSRPVTDVETEIELIRPAQSLALINDGPSAITISINDNANPYQVNNREPYQIDFRGHKLARFYLKCGPGLTASVRAVVKG
jgi:hypothetical protein